MGQEMQSIKSLIQDKEVKYYFRDSFTHSARALISQAHASSEIQNHFN